MQVGATVLFSFQSFVFKKKSIVCIFRSQVSQKTVLLCLAVSTALVIDLITVAENVSLVDTFQSCTMQMRMLGMLLMLF